MMNEFKILDSDGRQMMQRGVFKEVPVTVHSKHWEVGDTFTVLMLLSETPEIKVRIINKKEVRVCS